MKSPGLFPVNSFTHILQTLNAFWNVGSVLACVLRFDAGKKMWRPTGGQLGRISCPSSSISPSTRPSEGQVPP